MMADTVLLFLVSPPGGDCSEEEHHAAACAAWESLWAHNACLRPHLDSVLLVGVGSGGLKSEARLHSLWRTAQAQLPELAAQSRVVSLMRPCMGRALNDAMHWCTGGRANYVLVWDDAHRCSRPFWASARHVMAYTGLDVWQLALSEREYSELPPERFEERDGHSRVLPHPDEAAKRRLDPDTASDAELACLWPGFTLAPALHDMNYLRRARMPRFSEGKDVSWLWLQWQVGKHWEAAGGVCAVLEPAPACPVDSMEDAWEEEENESEYSGWDEPPGMAWQAC